METPETNVQRKKWAMIESLVQAAASFAVFEVHAKGL